MIKINLLKTYGATATADQDGSIVFQGDEKNQIIKDFAVRMFVFMLGPLGLYFYESSRIPELQSQINQLNQTLAELRQFNEKKKGLADEIRRYQEDQDRLKLQMAFMEKVATEKINELKLFQYLQKNTPEGVWLNRLELKGSDLTLAAESDMPQEIAKFLEYLANAPFLVNVSPTNQETKIDALGPGLTTTTFNVKASMATGAATP